jgi:hypothetical protein
MSLVPGESAAVPGDPIGVEPVGLFGPVPAVLARLRDSATIRARCAQVTAAVRAGESALFAVDDSRLSPVADRIAALTLARFPTLAIPYHSRWRHFEAGGVDRKHAMDERIATHSQAAQARARIDLALVSVLLDAGAGPQWRYQEAETGLTLARSEGLGVASFRAFIAGEFSSEPGDPCRVDAKALARIDAAALARIFQVDAGNPLVGLESRAALLRRLAQALREHPLVFGGDGQPGQLFDALTHHRHAPQLRQHHPLPSTSRHQIAAPRILRALLDAFSAIWPSGQHIAIDGMDHALGDAWCHPAAGADADDASAGWLPFHKLSQWLSYSLVEPFEWAGVTVSQLDGLTGLPEYRNGGLLLDAGVIVPRKPGWAARSYTPADVWVIEWRALTVHLLDELAPLVREHLAAAVPAELADRARALPLACLLEGGSWTAGRAIAAELRPGGPPPVSIDSDGTVF